MDNSPLDRGLSLTLSWGAAEERRRRRVSLGLFLRVGLALALCAVCYQAGRWHGTLEALSERSAARPLVSATSLAKSVPSANTGTGASGLAPGNAVGEPADVITPLNVRDPSALVMGPGASNPPTQTLQSAPVPAAPDAPAENPPARVFPRPKDDVKPSNRY